ncbi:MAG: hypothetical protein QOE11_820 [Solirubrobacteraceae bacterium]|nr:hypothetical protein [Solirubrobacteraceae bacterium]
MPAQLSCCLLVNTPPSRVAATLAPLRALGPEVVLAVDDRARPEWIEGYREIADRVLVVPFPGVFSRLYAWLAEECSGRWILQLDHDEVPSAGFAAEVAETIAAGDVTQGWVRRRWLYPDRDHYLAQWPWRPDYLPRLVRNDMALLRFPALVHGIVSAVGPRRYLREPLYHADLVLTDVAARERKCAEYERDLPGLVIDGLSMNEAYYLPERRADVRVLAVPADDAPAIAAFLDAPEAVTPAPAPVPVGVVERRTLDEITRRDESRTIGDGAYRARLELLDDDLCLVSGEWRTFDVEVHNLGEEHWPGGMDARPQIRLAYRWLAGDGGPPQEGARTALPASLKPGASVVVALEVLGPPSTGRYEIEIDLVHEDVRWFECGVRAGIAVRRPLGTARARR